MKKARNWFFSKRFAALLTLLSFLPTAANAQMLLPMLVPVAVFAQAEELEESDSASAEDKSLEAPSIDAAIETQVTAKRALPAPFKLAQATPVIAAAAALTLNPDAQVLLNDAASFQSQGDPINGALTLFRLMERYPNSLEASEGIRVLTQYALSMQGGTYTPSVIDAYEAQLPAWEQCRAPESRFVLMGHCYYRAMFAERAGNAADAEKYLSRAYDYGLRFLGEHSQVPLVLPVLQYLMAAAQALGSEVTTLTVVELEARLAAPPDFSTWCIRGVLGSYYYTQHSRPQQIVSFRGMLNQTDAVGISEVLSSQSVWPYLKAEILYRLGRAHIGVDEHDEALVYFQRVMDEYPNEGDKSALSAILRAELIDELYPDSPDQAILAFQEVVNRYPQSTYAPAALFFMSGVYNRFENFDYSTIVLNRIASDYPNAPVAGRANKTIETVLKEQWDGTPIAKSAEPGLLLASLCGPTALKYLLAKKRGDGDHRGGCPSSWRQQ